MGLFHYVSQLIKYYMSFCHIVIVLICQKCYVIDEESVIYDFIRIKKNI